MESDVHASRLGATGTVFAGPGRVKGIHIVDGASAGSVVLRDGGASGTILCTIDTPGSATEYQDISVPGNGIRIQTDIHATMTNVVAITVFYA